MRVVRDRERRLERRQVDGVGGADAVRDALHAVGGGDGGEACGWKAKTRCPSSDDWHAGGGADDIPLSEYP